MVVSSDEVGKKNGKSLVTLEILLNLLQARGLSDTAECLKREAGYEGSALVNRPASRDRSQSPGGRKGELNLVDLVTPSTEEALRQRSHNASVAQGEQQRRIASLAQEMAKQGKQMSEIRDLVHRVRNAATTINRPTLEEQEEQIQRNDAELRELEVICAERDALGRKLRAELDRTSAEVAELRRTLEEREDEETRARIQLTRLEEEALRLSCELETVPVMTQARKIQAVLASWNDEDGHIQLMIRQLFYDIDRDRDGKLEWNNNEIRRCVVELFQRSGINLPSWQEHVWYEMYRRADSDGSYSLELSEMNRFARGCFEAALALVLTGQAENGADVSVVNQFGRSTVAVTAVARSAMTYSSGIVIDFTEYATIFTPVITANSAHRVRMVQLIETGEHLKATMRTYRECDKDGNGRLTWNNGEIRDFITRCFMQHSLSPPNEEQIYHLFQVFDTDKNHALDMRECLELVDAIFRSIFIVEAGVPGQPVVKAAPGTVKYVTGTSTIGGNRQASPARVVQGGIQGGTIQGLATAQVRQAQVRAVSRDRVGSPRTMAQSAIVMEDVMVASTTEGTRISRSRSPAVVMAGSASAPLGSAGIPMGQVTQGQLQARRLNSGTGTFSPGVPMQGLSPRAPSASREGSVGPVVRAAQMAYPRTASPLEGSVILGGPSGGGQAASVISGAYGQPQLISGVPVLQSPNLHGRQPSMDRLQAANIQGLTQGALRNEGSPRPAVGLAQPVLRVSR